MALVICPPELVPFDRKRYMSDLDYRFECDQEIYSERHNRMLQLFHPEYLNTND